MVVHGVVAVVLSWVVRWVVVVMLEEGWLVSGWVAVVAMVEAC